MTEPGPQSHTPPPSGPPVDEPIDDSPPFAPPPGGPPLDAPPGAPPSVTAPVGPPPGQLPPPAGPPLGQFAPPVGVPVSTVPPGEPGVRQRPWWGMGDVLLGVPVIVVMTLVGIIIGGLVARAEGADLIGLATDGADPLVVIPPALLAFSLVGQQAGQFGWPLVVSRRKGLGPASDWRFRFTWLDLPIGFGLALITIGGAGVVSTVVSQVVNLTDEELADNTGLLREAEGTPWLYVILAGVLIGAPLSEELFFRGLILRSIEKRAGSVVAILGSSVIFTLPHFTNADLAGTLVLFSAILVVGLVFGVAAVQLDRLGPVIIAHMLFNLVGAAQGLGWLDSLNP